MGKIVLSLIGGEMSAVAWPKVTSDYAEKRFLWLFPPTVGFI